MSTKLAQTLPVVAGPPDSVTSWLGPETVPEPRNACAHAYLIHRMNASPSTRGSIGRQDQSLSRRHRSVSCGQGRKGKQSRSPNGDFSDRGIHGKRCPSPNGVFAPDPPIVCPTVHWIESVTISLSRTIGYQHTIHWPSRWPTVQRWPTARKGRRRKGDERWVVSIGIPHRLQPSGWRWDHEIHAGVGQEEVRARPVAR